MDFINIYQKPHHFVKVNLTTLQDKDGMYDLYKCKHCGLQGKRYGLSESILVDITLKKVKLCDGRKIEESKKEEKITETKILGKVKLKYRPLVIGADNLKEGDIVDIIRESERGVWIKGIEVTPELKKLDSNYNGEILLLFNEFERV